MASSSTDDGRCAVLTSSARPSLLGDHHPRRGRQTIEHRAAAAAGCAPSCPAGDGRSPGRTGTRARPVDQPGRPLPSPARESCAPCRQGCFDSRARRPRSRARPTRVRPSDHQPHPRAPPPVPLSRPYPAQRWRCARDRFRSAGANARGSGFRAVRARRAPNAASACRRTGVWGRQMMVPSGRAERTRPTLSAMGPPEFDIDLPPWRLEPTPRWVRVRRGDHWIADSTRSLAFGVVRIAQTPDLLSAAGCCANRSPEPFGCRDRCACRVHDAARCDGRRVHD